MTGEILCLLFVLVSCKSSAVNLSCSTDGSRMSTYSVKWTIKNFLSYNREPGQWIRTQRPITDDFFTCWLRAYPHGYSLKHEFSSVDIGCELKLEDGVLLNGTFHLLGADGQELETGSWLERPFGERFTGTRYGAWYQGLSLPRDQLQGDRLPGGHLIILAVFQAETIIDGCD